MSFKQRIILTAIFACTLGMARSQTAEKPPYIGYIYPAGGQKGSTFQVIVGGQNLRGAENARISGEGASAKVVQYMRPLTNDQKRELQKQIREARQKRTWRQAPSRRAAERNQIRQRDENKKIRATTETVTLPDYPLLRNLEEMSPQEIKMIEEEYLTTKKNQQGKGVVAEQVILEIRIDAKAAAGDREIRLRTPAGMTNPLRFQIGTMPEFCEKEPNDPNESSSEIFEIPAVWNGQIKPGDVDRFRFKARGGQRLVFESQARSLIPYMADAVPGWFQPVLTLYDGRGNEIAFADDYRLKPDGVLFYQIPKDGEYILEIRDSIYRGRDDFVYRIAAGEKPFITAIFPLGGRAGASVESLITGWNLESKKIKLDTAIGGGSLRQRALRQGGWLTNQVSYAVDDLPEIIESNTPVAQGKPQKIEAPVIVNGRIEKSGERDVFEFEGRAGDEIVAEVQARRLQSPLDSLLSLKNNKGRIIGMNDDCEDKALGLETHHADSYLRARLPEDGIYFIEISDTQGKGGEEYAYRLRVSPPQPDFALRMTPSAINLPTGGVVCLDVYAYRKDGFSGDIRLAMSDHPQGFKINGGVIPAGRDHVRVTVSAPWNISKETTTLKLEGEAMAGDKKIVRPVLPCDSMMQAFAYYHLVPAQELLVQILKGRRRGINLPREGGEVVEIPAGGSSKVICKLPPRTPLKDFQIQLSDPPKGISLRDSVIKAGRLEFYLEADGRAAKAGMRDNLIVEVLTERAPERKGGGKAAEKQKVSLGVLPAIPIEVVAQ